MKNYNYLLTHEQNRKNWQRSMREIGAWLNDILHDQDLSLIEVANITHIPANVLDEMEIGQGTFQLSHLLELCRFYGRRFIVRFGRLNGIKYDRNINDEEEQPAVETAKTSDNECEKVDESTEIYSDYEAAENDNAE